MSEYKEYTVRAYADRTAYYNSKGQFHREDGPAREWYNGSKEWWLNGENLTEAEFNNRTNKTSCIGKVVEIDGKKYKLTEVK